MSVSYCGLRIQMAKLRLEWKDLVKENIIGQRTRRALANDEYVDLETIEKLAIRLNCNIGDIVSIKK